MSLAISDTLGTLTLLNLTSFKVKMHANVINTKIFKLKSFPFCVMFIVHCDIFSAGCYCTMGGIVRFEKKICPSHFWPFLDVIASVGMQKSVGT